MWAALIAVGGAFVGVWAVIKYFLIMEVRINSDAFETIFDFCKNERRFVLHEELTQESGRPVIYSAFCFSKQAPWFYVNHGERLLTAGWKGKETVTSFSCFRWRYGRLKDFIRFKLKSLELNRGVPVQILMPRYSSRIGLLKQEFPPPLQLPEAWTDIANEAEEVFSGKRSKTGVLLYGPPGNGKTSLVKYLATKHRVPIKIVTLSPDMTNEELMVMFSEITPNCIVLFEDFDNYFDGRNCVIGSGNNSIKFSFDVILNAFDGVYNTYEGVVFIITVNNISKVDSALRNRPSRMKYVRCFDNPCPVLRAQLVPESWVASTEGRNLDQLLRLKEFSEQKVELAEAMKIFDKELLVGAADGMAVNLNPAN